MQTLRDIAGMKPTPAGLGESAVVMIDCQNTYRQGVMKLTGVEDALEEGRRLLERARAAKVPIFHIRHDAGPGSPYDVTSKIGEIAEIVAPKAGEPTITKTFPNSFVKTDLEEQLQATGRKNVILAGFMTHVCVNSTARAAFNRGYGVTVVGKATATRDLPDGKDGVMDAHSLHVASLVGLADLFAVVVDGVDDIPE
jgi:nicotinamidase-related amidase